MSLSPITDSPPQVLVLGATGQIGQAVVRDLLRHGYSVRGLSRRASGITLGMPLVNWRYLDIANLRDADQWRPLIAGCGVIVNLAGALQDGSRDRLDDIHGKAIAALASACPSDGRLVHVSAPDADPGAATEFYRSKAAGDGAVRASGCDWVILRPVVVLGREAYGGSALLRSLAAFPGFIPAVHGGSILRTVALDDVVAVIRMAVDGRLAAGSDLVLAGPDSHTLAEVLIAFRAWLGLAPAPVVSVPFWAARAISVVADVAGYLGWRSPLRTTALIVTSEGVAASGTGISCMSLAEFLSLMPATVQERWFARMYLLKPLIVIVLALFWFASGAVGLFQTEAAAATFTLAGFSAGASKVSVVLGAVVDMVLGGLAIHRGTLPWALLCMIVVTLFYLAAAAVFAPGLWLDPFGPMVKAVPALVLALVALAILPER